MGRAALPTAMRRSSSRAASGTEALPRVRVLASAWRWRRTEARTSTWRRASV